MTTGDGGTPMAGHTDNVPSRSNLPATREGESTTDCPFYIRHTDLTDKGGIDTTAVFCCSQERNSTLNTGG